MKTLYTINTALLIGLLFLGRAAPLLAQNLLINGDFEAGNTGFTSGYTYSPGAIEPQGTYDIVRNPRNSHPGAASFTDRTSGAGFMLAANGAADTNLVIWRQSVQVATHTNYQFSGWVASWGDDGSGHDANPAKVRVSINGIPIDSAFQVTNVDGQWQRFSVQWNSGAATEAIIEIRLETAEFLGNDPAFG